MKLSTCILPSQTQYPYLLFLLLFGILLLSSQFTFAQQCDCTEMLYLNERKGPGKGVHKFAVNENFDLASVVGGDASASATEIGTPWYKTPAGGDLFDPHGIALDLNGFAYVGETDDGDIRRFTCDGELFPHPDDAPSDPTAFAIIDGGFNFASLDGMIYINRTSDNNDIYGYDGIIVYDPCDAAAPVGYYCLDEVVSENNDWGFWIDQNGIAYATGHNDGLNAASKVWIFDVKASTLNAPGAASPVCIAPILEMSSTSTDVNIGDSFLPNLGVDNHLGGVASDGNGNIWIAQQAGGGNSAGVAKQAGRMLKYTFNTTSNLWELSAKTAWDNAADGDGWYEPIAIVYSEKLDALFTTSRDPDESCIYLFDRDLNPVGNVQPPTGSNEAKGLGIITECCPVNSSDSREFLVCDRAVGQKVYLNYLLNCNNEGGVCEGQWEEISAIGIDFNDCDLSLTLTAENSCGQYRISKGPKTGNQQCDAFDYDVTICFGDFDATLVQSDCNNNGTPADTSDDYFTITANTSTSNTNSAATIEVVLNADDRGLGGTILATGLVGTPIVVGDGTNGATGTFVADGSTTYDITVRILGRRRGCNEVFTTTTSVCNVASCSLTDAGKTAETCNDNGTNSISSDDYITFSLNPIGSTLATTYSVSADNGGIVTLASGAAATAINYGSATSFRLQNGSADGLTNYTITITDDGTAGCQATTTVMQNSCSVPTGACSCNEYVYLNEPSGGGKIHKYLVNPDGALTEINEANTWFNNNIAMDDMSEPHGLATDLNGFLYVAETSSGDLRKMTCEGVLLPENDFVISGEGGWNFASIDNTVFLNSASDAEVAAYNVCTGDFVYGIDLCTTENDRDWGFHYDKRTGYFYSAVKGLGATTENVASIYRYTIDDFSNPVNGCVSPWITPGDGVLTPGVSETIANTFLRGMTTDPAGNLYIVERTDDRNTARLLKYDVDGNFVTATAYDADDTGTGWNRGAGVVYSEVCNCIYMSTAADDDDCISTFDLDLNYIEAGVPGNDGGFTGAKAIGITKECCPNTTPQNYDETVCSNGNGEKVFLQNIFSCGDGIICGGQWTETANTSGGNIVFDDCDLSIIVNGSGCATYTLSNTDATSSCGVFEIVVNVCTEVPEANLDSNQGTCSGGNPNDDATISLSNILAADEANLSIGTSYSGPNYGNVANLNVSGGSGSLTDLMHNTQYTVRIWNGSNDCFVDETIMTPTINCTVPCSLTNAVEMAETCNDNGTNSDPSDDYITFSLNPTGTNLDASYSVSANNNGTVTLVGGGAATGITYGNTTAFRLQNGSADGATNFTITITDDTDSNCTITTNVTQMNCSTTTCPTITNPTTSQTICANETIPTLQVSTTAMSPNQIEFVYFSSQQTNTSMYSSGISLGNATFSGGVASINEVSLPAAGTYYIYAILSPVPADVNCRPFAEIIVNVNPLPVNNFAVSDTIICEGNQAQIFVYETNSGFIYQAQNDTDDSLLGSPITSTGGTINFRIRDLTSGNHLINILVTDSNTGCSTVLLDQSNVQVYLCDYDLDRPGCPQPACHFISDEIYLGSGVNAEADNTGEMQVLDDGIVFPNNIHRGNTIQIPVSIYNNTGVNAHLSGWIDWNGDGDFDDTGEQIATESYPPSTYNGAYTVFLPTIIPVDAMLEQDIISRFRVSTDALSISSPCGTDTCAANGEVEDYLLRIECPSPQCLPVQLLIRRE